MTEKLLLCRSSIPCCHCTCCHCQSLICCFVICCSWPLPGHETTASTLGFLLYHLAVNPDWEQRLREEVRVRQRLNTFLLLLKADTVQPLAAAALSPSGV